MTAEIYAIVIGVGIEIIFVILGIQVQEMPPWLAIIGYVLGGICLVYGIIGLSCPKLRISSVVKGKPDKKESSLKAEAILIQIHKRMLELKDKAARQYYLKHSFKEFLDLCNDVMGATGKDTGLKNIRKGLSGKKLSKNRGKKRGQIDNLLDQVKPTLSMDWSLDALVKFVNKFNRLAQTSDKRYEGLDTLRDKDKRWAKLFGELQNVKTEFNDALLNKMIDDYIDWSYGCSGLSLLSDLFRHIPTEILPTKYLESEAFRPSIEVENTMTKLRGDIISMIKELQDMGSEAQHSGQTNGITVITHPPRLVIEICEINFGLSGDSGYPPQNHNEHKAKWIRLGMIFDGNVHIETLELVISGKQPIPAFEWGPGKGAYYFYFQIPIWVKSRESRTIQVIAFANGIKWGSPEKTVNFSV